MNQTLEDIKSFFVEVNKLKTQLTCEAWIAPQAIHLPIVKELAFTLGQVKVGAQNCSEHNSGAYTGETSPTSLVDLGASFTLVGHSERRTLFNEDNELLNKKLHAAMEAGLTAIFCVGETLEEREANKTAEVIAEQIKAGLKSLSAAKSNKLIVAYEPVWAIGTGETATPIMAQEVHAQIRCLLGEMNLPADSIPILYGGSVKPDNVQELLSCLDIDGGLVGGASLKGQSFAELCQFASF